MIVYLISSYKGVNTGKGGHYYSVMTIAQEVAKVEDILLVNIGNFRASSLDNFNGKSIFIKHEFYNTLFVYFKLYKILKDKKIKAIHSFDKHSIFFGRCLSIKFKIPLICTKCGGPIYERRSNVFARYYPNIKNQTVFHNQDFEYFKKFKSIENLQNISARVKFNKEKIKLSKEIENFYENTEFKLMRICRIGKFYFSTIESIINFLKKQLLINNKSKLVIIGYLEDKKYLAHIEDILKKENLKDKVLILTDKFHTFESSGFLHYANIVLGTGRSFMEASSYGHVMLAPVQNNKYPCLATEFNIEQIESNNFSTRTPNTNQTDFFNNELDWMKIINDEFSRLKYKKWILEIFNERYNIETSIVKYLKFYKLDNYEEKKLDLVWNIFILHIYLIKGFFKK